MRNFVDLFGRKPAVVWHDSKLGETLNMFRKEKSHMAIVRDVDAEGTVSLLVLLLVLWLLVDIVADCVASLRRFSSRKQSCRTRQSCFGVLHLFTTVTSITTTN